MRVCKKGVGVGGGGNGVIRGGGDLEQRGIWFYIVAYYFFLWHLFTINND